MAWILKKFCKAAGAISFLFICSCSHFVKKESKNPGFSISHSELPSKTLYKRLDGSYKSSFGDIPLDSHPDVQKWINYFTGRGRSYMTTYLERSSRYMPLMQSALKENDLPVNLFYIALIESGFSPRALSRSNAVGYWQFIYGTGKRYGLRIDGYVDERKDPVLSTRAAANYFKDLFSLFGSWHLALAAYNSGEFRVNRAVLRHYNRDFWHLSRKKALPRETRNYVPKFIAAVLISKNPAKYGFHNLQYQEPISYELVSVKKPISLKSLAGHINSPIEEIKQLNPMYKGEYVPIYEKEALIRVPAGMKAAAAAAIERSYMKQPKYSYHYHYWHRVRRGDSLYKIARRHRTSIRKLQRANNLGRSAILRIGQRIKIPANRLIASKKPSRRPAKAKGEFHIVKKGQSLSFIARLYGLPLSKIKSLNSLSKNLIHPGQKLRIKKAAPAGAESSKTYHTVRRGETLIGIAKKYKIPLPSLMKANSLNFRSVLLTGAKLLIPK